MPIPINAVAAASADDIAREIATAARDVLDRLAFRAGDNVRLSPGAIAPPARLIRDADGVAYSRGIVTGHLPGSGLTSVMVALDSGLEVEMVVLASLIARDA